MEGELERGAAEPAPEQPHQATRQHGKHGDVHARDAHEVGYAGGGENGPVRCRYGLLLSHHQPRQHTRMARLGDSGSNGLPNGISGAIDLG
jgi:hypothetical protein